MKPDPAIDEIRAVRRKISAEFSHDPRRLMAHYVEFEKQLQREGRFHFVEMAASETEAIALNDKSAK
jgi:hypothetical protein